MHTCGGKTAVLVLVGICGAGGTASCASILGLDAFSEGSATTGRGGGGGGGSGGEGTSSSQTGGMTCVPGAVDACYSGPAATRGVGTCKDGKRTCAADGSGWSACSGEVLPAADDCSTKADENCDGFACGGTVWAQGFGDGVNQYGHSVTVDESGNIYVLGDFYGAMKFGTTNLISQGNVDVFLAKLDPAGNAIWAKSFGAAGAQSGNAITRDSMGNVVATGTSETVIDLGCGAGPLPGAWVAKWDSTGKCIWSSGCASTGGLAGGNGVVVDSTGNVIVAGEAGGSVDCGSGVKASVAGSGDILLAKFASNGTPAWTKTFGDNAIQGAKAIAIDASDNVVITGVTFGTTNLGGLDLVDTGNGSTFLLRLNAAGAHMWSGAFPNSTGTAVAVDEIGGPVVIGAFMGMTDFGSGPLTSFGPGSNLFIARFGAAGNPAFSHGFGGASGRSIAISKSGNATLLGDFGGATINFGGSDFSNLGQSDVFVVTLDAKGNHLWSRSYGGSAADSGRSVAMGPAGEIVITGDFGATSDFGAAPLVSTGLADVFVAKLVP